MEFNFKKELQKIYEEELIGRQTNAGRIYRKFILRDEEFIRLLKEDIDSNGCCMSCKDRIKQTINQRAGDKLTNGKDYNK